METSESGSSCIDMLIDSMESPKKNTIRKAFKLARSVRTASDWPGQHLGAVIMYKNKVLSVGWNSKKESPMQKHFNKYRDFDENAFPNNEHAEIRAIRTLLHDYNEEDIDFSKVSIYIYREKKDKSTGLAKPCPACEMAIRKLGIKNIYYTGENSILHEIYKIGGKE